MAYACSAYFTAVGSKNRLEGEGAKNKCHVGIRNNREKASSFDVRRRRVYYSQVLETNLNHYSILMSRPIIINVAALVTSLIGKVQSRLSNN
jgi:hypothetical protein